MLIEDDKNIIDILKILSKKNNLSIKSVINTGAFLSLIKQKYKFKVILSDINLDYEFEGFDIAKIFHNLSQKRKQNTKLIAFTALMLPKEFFQDKGFDSVIYKDFNNIKSFINRFIIEKKPPLTKNSYNKKDKYNASQS